MVAAGHGEAPATCVGDRGLGCAPIAPPRLARDPREPRRAGQYTPEVTPRSRGLLVGVAGRVACEWIVEPAMHRPLAVVPCFGFRGLHLGGDDREDSGGEVTVLVDGVGVDGGGPFVPVPPLGVLVVVQLLRDAFL